MQFLIANNCGWFLVSIQEHRVNFQLSHQSWNFIKRIAVALQGQLKGQFGLIADQVAGMILAVGRGGSDVVRLRTLREYISQLRTTVELNVNKVKAQHSVEIEISGG